MESANDQAQRALEILESSDIVQEFGDSLWLRVDRELWEEFTGERSHKDSR